MTGGSGAVCTLTGEEIMEIIRELVRSSEPTATALGYFDGVHRGHRAVIAESVAYAREHGLVSAVFTLQQSPRTVLFGEEPKGIITLEEKLQQLAQLGVERVYLIDFRTIRHITAEDFVRDILLGCFHAKHTGCGFNYHFGSGAKGDGNTLSHLAQAYGITETTQPQLCYGGLPISSTRIRQCIAQGDIPSANAMLGRAYGFCLPIIHGQQLGRQLGFPTLNQSMPDGLIKPLFGVYASVVTVNGVSYRGVTNIGRKPTVGADSVTIETWMPDYHGGELYDEVLDVRLYGFVRPEQRFDSLDALRRAVEQDAAAVMAHTIDTKECEGTW